MNGTATNGRQAAGAGESPPRAVARNSAELLHDTVQLAELQGRLLVVDVQQALQGLKPALGAVVGALIVVLGCIPVALAGIALAITELTGATPAVAFIITACVAAGLAGVVALAALRNLRRSVECLDRSRTEWNRNLEWVKEMLNQMGNARRSPTEAAERRARPSAEP